MAKKNEKKKSPFSTIASVVLALAFLNTEILIALLPIAILVGVFWLGIRAARKAGSRKSSAQTRQKTTYLRECSVPLSLHRDKGHHHVRRGPGDDPWDNLPPEIDPWDRPDIDIRRYQRRK